MNNRTASLLKIAVWALLVLALVCLTFVVMNNHQAILSKPWPLTFSGEYSQDGEHWLPLTGTDLSFQGGTLSLRGRFDTDIPEGLRIYWYRDHIGVEMAVNGELVSCDTVAMLLQEDIQITPDLCGSLWDYQLSPGITPGDTVEFHLYAPHSHGSQGAIQEFLGNLYLTGDNTVILSGFLKSLSTPLQGYGLVLMIVALLILGGSLAALFLHTAHESTLWIDGLLCLFTGGFVFLDTVNISLLSELVVFNTYGKLLCIMLAVYLGQLYLCRALTGKRQTLAQISLLLSAVINCGLIFVSFVGKALLYDGLFPWKLSQAVLCPLFILCALAELHREKSKGPALISGLLLMAAILADIAGVGASMYSHGSCSKLVFLVLFCYQTIRAIQHAVLDHRASQRAKELERELEDSRIAAMLSQMQPHFLYNVLNSIYQLCEVNPKTAQDAIEKFSDYLRSNMASLEETELIPFEEEYRHIQAYLSLEKIRFPSTLQVAEDIRAVNFKVPPLTVQVLVENAVKHGVTKKRGGGTVTLSTRELPDCWQIVVEDTGRGFDIAHCAEDGKAHFGLRNARERLRLMVGGTLSITSAPEQGTRAEIRIPKGGSL